MKEGKRGEGQRRWSGENEKEKGRKRAREREKEIGLEKFSKAGKVPSQ